MKRSQAIEQYAKIKLKELSEEERLEQLEIMMLEDWSDSNEWSQLSDEIKAEFRKRELNINQDIGKYDKVLMIWLKDDLKAITNDFLMQKLKLNFIEGKPIVLIECPCCGSRTIGERGNYEICKVCWWEDDGQDNQNANDIMGGPNYGISLTQGRYNFLKYGIYDPTRVDLIKLIGPSSKYTKGREFKLEGEYVYEIGTNLKWKLKTQ